MCYSEQLADMMEQSQSFADELTLSLIRFGDSLGLLPEYPEGYTVISCDDHDHLSISLVHLGDNRPQERLSA